MATNFQGQVLNSLNTLAGAGIGLKYAKEAKAKEDERVAEATEKKKQEESYKTPTANVYGEVAKEFEEKGVTPGNVPGAQINWGQRFYSPEVQERVMAEMDYARNFMENQRQLTNARLADLKSRGLTREAAMEESRGQQRKEQNLNVLRENLRASVTAAGQVGKRKVGTGYGNYTYKDGGNQ